MLYTGDPKELSDRIKKYVTSSFDVEPLVIEGVNDTDLPTYNGFQPSEIVFWSITRAVRQAVIPGSPRQSRRLDS